MNKLTWKLMIVVLLGGGVLSPGCGDGDTHRGPGHADHGEEDGGHDDHEEHGSDVVRLTQEQLDRAGVVIEPLGGGTIATHLSLPAEVGLNEDTVVHITPRVPGIVIEVRGLLGDEVKSGDLLAVLESPALGEARIEYLQALRSRSVAEAELARQRVISENTATLLDILREQPTPESLQERAVGLRIGENKGRLLTAYSKMRAAEANYARERDLREKQLSAQSDLLSAQEAFNSTRAEYIASFEDIDFTFRVRLQDAEQSAGVAASAVDNARRRLGVLGLNAAQIDGIADSPDLGVARYELTAPADGRIVAKHITPGEMLSAGEAVYTLADLSSVWLNISVYTRYAGMIKQGDPVVVHAGARTTTGVVGYVDPFVSEATRTVSARVVIETPDGSWKPGEFVTALVETGRMHADRVVPLEAVQTFEGRRVVFVRGDEGIEPTPVTLGRSDDQRVELLGDDIPIGAMIVVGNSFLMKSELGKGAAGHEH